MANNFAFLAVVFFVISIYLNYIAGFFSEKREKIGINAIILISLSFAAFFLYQFLK